MTEKDYLRKRISMAEGELGNKRDERDLSAITLEEMRQRLRYVEYMVGIRDSTEHDRKLHSDH